MKTLESTVRLDPIFREYAPDVGAQPPDAALPEIDNQMLNPQRHTSDVSPAIDTDAGEAVARTAEKPVASLPWYVLWVRPRGEKAVRDRLVDSGFEAYTATRREIHLWRSKDMRHKEKKERKVVEVVVIPSVVFVRIAGISESDRNRKRDQIQATPGVSAFMQDPSRKHPGSTFWHIIARVPDSELQLLRAMLGQEDFEVAFTPSQFALGEYVKVEGFDTGTHNPQIVRLPNDNKSYVGIRVDFLGCAYMEVPLNRIVKIKEPAEVPKP